MFIYFCFGKKNNISYTVLVTNHNRINYVTGLILLFLFQSDVNTHDLSLTAFVLISMLESGAADLVNMSLLWSVLYQS